MKTHLSVRFFQNTSRRHQSTKVFLVAGKRTPFGKFGESLKDIKPVDLSVLASKAILAETSLDPTKIDHVIFANVCPSTTDTIYGARHLALKLGAKIETPGYTVNRLCGSGIQAIVDASHMIQRGEAECVLASGSENMSMIPHLTYGTRFGTRFGPFKTEDMLMDSLTDQYCKTPMAITAENLASRYEISREECDEFAVRSHNNTQKAYKNGHLQGEVVNIPIRKGELTQDEHFRQDANMEQMAKLKPSFQKEGTVTPATASGIVDGAASVLVASEKFCEKEGLTPLAEIGDYSVVGVEPTIMGIGPAPAIRKLLAKTGKDLKDIDLVEINEAFAAQTLACVKELNLDLAKFNLWGGAISIGHPLGASGVRLSLTLSRQLKAMQLKTGIASACIGGGQGIALMLHAVQ